MVWKEYCEDIIDLIRQYDPDTIIIVGGLQAAYDLSFVPQAPIERSDIVYAAHVFPAVDWRLDWDSAFGDMAYDYPVFAEIGFNNQCPHQELRESAYRGPIRYRDAVTTYLEERGISWTVWSFSHVWDPTLLLDTDYTPTESGEFFRDQLLHLNE
jgi:hypothetical protein